MNKMFPHSTCAECMWQHESSAGEFTRINFNLQLFKSILLLSDRKLLTKIYGSLNVLIQEEKYYFIYILQ